MPEFYDFINQILNKFLNDTRLNYFIFITVCIYFVIY